MANTFQVSQLIAMESLYALKNYVNMGATVYRAIDREFASTTRASGETITVRKPATLVARDAITDLAGAGLQVQTVTESNVQVTLNKQPYVRVSITDKDLSLNIGDLRRQVIEPQILPIIEQVETYLHALYADIPYFTGTAGTTPDSLDDIANCGALMTDNKAPKTYGRFMQVNGAAQAKFWPLLAQLKTAADASNDALVLAAIGRTGGYDIYENQAVAYHTKGTLAGGATASGVAAASTITIAAGGDTKTLVAGDLITIADVVKADGSSYQFVVTALATTSGAGAATVSVYPALPSTFNAKAVTLIGSHRANLAYTRNAFCMATARLALPLGGAVGAEATDSESGLTLRTVYDYVDKANIIDVDMLCGFKTLRQEEAVRLLG